MASKLQAVVGMADKLTSDLTAHRGAWRQFLQTAARVYKYSFSDQLLTLVSDQTPRLARNCPFGMTGWAAGSPGAHTALP